MEVIGSEVFRKTITKYILLVAATLVEFCLGKIIFLEDFTWKFLRLRLSGGDKQCEVETLYHGFR
jgi:hypothetical protein